MGFSRQEYWSGLPISSPVDHILSGLSTMTHPSWVAPRAWLSHWVRQGCGPSVIRLTSFLWVWFQFVCPLMLSCNTYHLTWVSLTLGVGYLFMAAPAKRSHCSLPWMKGISSLPPFLTFLQSMGSQRVGHNWVTELNWYQLWLLLYLTNSIKYYIS